MKTAEPLTGERAVATTHTSLRLPTPGLTVAPRDAKPALHDPVGALYRDAGLSPALIELAESRTDLAMLAVASGAGAALLPRSVKERHKSPGIRVVDVATPEPAFQYALLTHPHD